MSFKLNGKEVKEPQWDIEYYNITKSSRSASGLMNMDFIAKKRKFICLYEVLSGAELDKILSIINTSTMFINLEYLHNGVTKYATVYVGPIKAKKFRSHMGWYWKDVRFNLIER